MAISQKKNFVHRREEVVPAGQEGEQELNNITLRHIQSDNAHESKGHPFCPFSSVRKDLLTKRKEVPMVGTHAGVPCVLRSRALPKSSLTTF